MATLESVKAKIQGLIEKANIVTSRADTQLSPAVDALIAGYGTGGGGFVDVTELPDISEAEADVVYRLLQKVKASVGIYVAVYDGAQTTVMSLDDMFAAEGAPINTKIYVVSELPEVMEMIDEATLTIPFYVIESTGIAYLSLDGTNNEVATAGEMFESPEGDGGWIESTENIPQDKLQLGMNLFCMRSEESIAVKGLYLAVDGEWQSYKEVIDVEELPVSGANQNAIYRVGKTLHRGLYIVDASRDIHDFAEYCEENNMQMGTVEFVNTLPEVAESDQIIYVLNATGELYIRGSDGRPQNVNEHGLFVLFFGGSHGWTDPDAINLFKPGIYTCTGEGFYAKEMCRYVDGAWMIYSIENIFADLVEGKLEHITSKELKQVNSITQGAFSDMHSIKSIEIPASVGSIQNMAFKNCYNLETVNFLGDSCSIGRSAFEGCTSLKNINIEDLTGIDTVEYCAFKDCTALESVEIRPSNRYFWQWGNYVFEGCTSLKKVVLDFINSDGDIDPQGTFKNCSSLTEFVLPDDWQYGSLPNEMFRGCKALKDIQLTWGAIGAYAFMESGITNCHFNGTKAQWQQVEKGYWWDRFTPDYVIHCTDGDILKSDPESGSDDTPDEPESSGMELNIAYGDTPPEDTTKLWVKTSEPSKVNISSTTFVETLSKKLSAVLWETKSVATVGTKIYIFGGVTTSATHTKRAFCFDTETEEITSLPSLVYEMSRGNAVAVDSKIYIFNGSTNNQLHDQEIYVFDTITQQYTKLDAKLPQQSHEASCHKVGKYIYIIGGYRYSLSSLNNTVCRLDTETDVITTLEAVVPVAAGQMESAVVDTKIYLFSGQTRYNQVTTACYCFDTTTETFTTIASSPIAIAAGACYEVDGTIYILGGQSATSSGNKYYNTIYVYDPNSNTFSLFDAVLTKARSLTLFGSVGASLYMFGGMSGGTSSGAIDIERFKPYALTPNGELEILTVQGSPKVNLMSNDKIEVALPVHKVFKGTYDKGEQVEAAIYTNDTWTNI